MDRTLKAKIVLLYGTQADAAAALGICEPRLSRILNGRVQPKSDELKILREHVDAEFSPATSREPLAV